MTNSRLTFVLVALPWVVSCGLLTSERDLPKIEVVHVARAAAEVQWSLLDAALAEVEKDPKNGLLQLRQRAAVHPDDVRLAIFLQDMELRVEGEDAMKQRSMESFIAEPSALNTFLWARIQEEPEDRFRLLDAALELDPNLVQAQVYRIAMEARAGHPEVLDELIDLLHANPGSAEAWRLMGELAPLFGRSDLARAAAETEPWSGADTPKRAAYTLAMADLNAGNARAALDQARDLPPEMWQGRLLEAAALAALDNPQKALSVVEEVLKNRPEEPAALFNKALLLRDYLGRSAEARPVLEHFLEASRASGEANMLRVMQAEFWLGMTVTT